MVHVFEFPFEFSYSFSSEVSMLSWGLCWEFLGLEWESEAKERGCKVFVVVFKYVFPRRSPFGVFWTVFVLV